GIVPEPFASASHIIDFGPGCKVTRVFVTEDPNIVLYWITIWGTLHMHVRIDLKAELQKVRLSKFEGLPTGREKAGMKVPDYLRKFDETTKGSI
ncbi:MAG TPA: hypothetical protein VK493_00060, partial [Bryobacteraceae bacterium]|nr:hypothetical protein [Bryobacteraceae bacterium]